MPGALYVFTSDIHASQMSAYKIGIVKSIANDRLTRRLSEHRCSCIGGRYVKTWLVEKPLEVERMLHLYYKDRDVHIELEWFKLSNLPLELAMIESLISKNLVSQISPYARITTFAMLIAALSDPKFNTTLAMRWFREHPSSDKQIATAVTYHFAVVEKPKAAKAIKV